MVLMTSSPIPQIFTSILSMLCCISILSNHGSRAYAPLSVRLIFCHLKFPLFLCNILFLFIYFDSTCDIFLCASDLSLLFRKSGKRNSSVHSGKAIWILPGPRPQRIRDIPWITAAEWQLSKMGPQPRSVRLSVTARHLLTRWGFTMSHIRQINNNNNKKKRW